MDNQGIPLVQPSGQDQSVQPLVSGTENTTQTLDNKAMPMIKQVQAPGEKKKDIGGLIKTVVIIIVSLIAVTFIGLFIWMFVRYNETQNSIDDQISRAVAEEKDKQAIELEAKFAQMEKNPFKTFSGPVDYGQLTFNYPKTWSVYVAEAANAGGDFNAYFNPIQVDTVSKDTINALRVTIVNKSFEDVTATYQKAMDKRDSNLKVESIVFGRDQNVNGNLYTGTIPDTELSGYIVIFKIRDKTVILQTDSVLFKGDFDAILETITFNA